MRHLKIQICFFSMKRSNKRSLLRLFAYVAAILIFGRVVVTMIFAKESPNGSKMEGDRIKDILMAANLKSQANSSLAAEALPSTWPDPNTVTYVKKQDLIPQDGILYILSSKSPLIPYYKKRFEESGGRTTMYVKELKVSLESVRAHNHRISITLLADDSSVVPNDIWNQVDNIIIQKISAKASWVPILINLNVDLT